MANKKAQITLFIIIGIIIVLATAIVIIYMNLSKTIKDEEITEKFGEVPLWAMPVKKYIDNCIEEKAIKALNEIGRHGGYIDMTDEYLSEKTFNLNKNPVESDAVFLSENSNPVAYWWYLETETTCTDCEMSSQMPSLIEIEQQVNRYIERELPLCIDDFKSFRKQGFDFEIEEIKTNTSINLEDVSVSVNYPITIKKADSKTKIIDFSQNIDLSFFDIYTLASLINFDEYQNQTFDDLLSNWLHYYSQPPDKDKIPPPIWIDNKKSIVTWKDDDVKKTMKEAIIPYYVSLTQVNGTRNATHIVVNDPLVQGIYDMHFLNIINYSYSDLSVSFFYSPSWEIYFDISPKKGQMIEPTTTITEYPLNIMQSDQTNDYESFYDISHPIVVIIRDIHSLKKHGEKGYSFMFAFEANIRDNKNLLEWHQGRGTIGHYDYSGVSVSTSIEAKNFEDCIDSGGSWTCPITGEKFSDGIVCSKKCFSKSAISTPKTTKKQICDTIQKISDINLTVTDSSSAPVEGASVRFRCGNYATCPLGSTNSDGKFSGKSPMCIGDSFLIVEKTGVLSKTINIGAIEPGKSYEFSASLNKLTELDATVVYINVTNLFHTKEYLMSIFNNLYYEIMGDTEMEGHGLLQDIIDTAEDTSTDPPISRLSSSELSQINTAKQNILNSKIELSKYSYFYDMVDTKVIDAALKTRDAINLAKEIIDKYESTFLSSLSDSYEPYYTELNKRTKNIQFLQGSELSDSTKIEKYRSEALSLNENDEVTININKIKTNSYDNNVPIPKAYINKTEKGYVSLASGKYEIIATLTDKKGYVIPHGDGSEKNYPSIYSGGLQINETIAWGISNSDLSNKKDITFYILKLDKFESTDDMNEIGNIKKYSERFRNFLEPEIK